MRIPPSQHRVARALCALLLAPIHIFLAATAAAEVPALLNFQGRLLDGTNLVNGNVGLSLRLYSVPVSGSPIYEDSNSVPVADGLYSTFLGDQTNSGNFAQALTNAAVWIEVAVNGATLTPRERLAASAYALVAEGVRPGGITSAMFAPGSVTASALANGAALAEISDNDGAGSGLDADLLDGRSSAAFATGTPLYVEADSTAWRLTGNAGTLPGTHFLGTADNQPLELRVNNVRALRLSETAGVPALTGGHASNTISAAAAGSAIGGGGNATEPNQISATYSVISGGASNSVADRWSAIGGGRGNQIATLDIPSARDYGTIGGGLYNTIGAGALAGHLGTIAGGGYNTVASDLATVGGGRSNVASGVGAVVGGGDANSASADQATVGGGLRNAAAGDASTVGGGANNRAAAIYGTVAGGRYNAAADYATVGGGYSNLADSSYVTIAGGRENAADGYSSAIGGGEYNEIASGQRSTIGGGSQNRILTGAGYAVIAGGVDNVIGTNASDGFIGGGQANQISIGSDNVIGGGWQNQARGEDGVIGGGSQNGINGSANYAFIAGGSQNIIGTNASYSAIGGGLLNRASNVFATVLGGYQNVAAGSNSVAAGAKAHALHHDTFVWSDDQGAAFYSVTNNEFAIASSNGVRIADNLLTNTLDLIGRRYRDNSIYAWATISGGGVIRSSFGVASVTNISQGVYNVVLQASAVDYLSICATVTPEMDAAPANAGALRLAGVNAVSPSNRFVQVFINNGSGAPTNNDFNLIVTGR